MNNQIDFTTLTAEGWEALYARLAELAGKATPGPWIHRTVPGFDEDGIVQAPKLDPSHPYNIQVLGDDRNERLYPPELYRADAAYISEADPPTVLALIARCRALEAELEDERQHADVYEANGGKWYRENLQLREQIAALEAENARLRDIQFWRLTKLQEFAHTQQENGLLAWLKSLPRHINW
jgi:hypothetical protein